MMVCDEINVVIIFLPTSKSLYKNGLFGYLYSHFQTFPVKKKILEWFHRYAWAEVVSTILTYGFGWSVSLFSSSSLAVAYAGTAGAAIGFYGFIFIRDYRRSVRKHRPENRRERWRLVWKTIRNMTFEFGLAEILDLLLVRPFFLLYGPKVLDSYFWGVLVGKTLADTVFFLLSIVMLEIRKKHLKWH